MQGTMVTINSTGVATYEAITAPPSLEALQAAVGGFIEAIGYFDQIKASTGAYVPCVAFCNEEGKLKRMPMNHVATRAWQHCQRANRVPIDDVLVGNVVVIYGDAELLDSL